MNGDFMGKYVPCAIHLKPGEYNLAVKKNGYTSWERKVKVTGGNVNLVAELQEKN